MSFSGAIKAGGAYVEITTKQKGLDAGLKAIAGKLKSWGANLTAVGAGLAGIGSAVLAPLLGSVKVFESMGSAAVYAAARTGLTVEALSELRFATEQSGASVEDLEISLKRMQKVIAGADDESKQAAAALAKFGVSVESLSGLSPDEPLARLADGLAAIDDPAHRTSAALAVFGKSGTKLLPLLKDGSARLDALRQKARDWGLTMSTKDAVAAEAFGGQLAALWSQIKMVSFSVGAAMLPMLAELVTATAPVIRGFMDWVKANPGLIQGVAAAAAVVVGLGGGLTVLGAILAAAGAALGAVGAVAGAILSPMGLLLTAVGAIGAALLYTSVQGETMGDKLANVWASIQAGATQALDFLLHGAALLTVAWNHLPEVLNLLPDAAAYAFSYLGDRFSWLTKQASIFGEWFSKNWVELILQTVCNVSQVFINFGELVDKVFKVIAAKMSDPLHASKYKLDLGAELSQITTKGMLNLVGKGPEFTEFKPSKQTDMLGQNLAAAAKSLTDEELARQWKDALVPKLPEGLRPRIGPDGEEELPDLLGAAKVFGTFDASLAAQQFGAMGGPQERAAKAAEDTNRKLDEVIRLTRRNNRLTENSGDVFA